MALGQLMMMNLGMLLGMLIIKARAVMSASIGVVLLLYVASMFVNMNERLDWLKYFTPFQYFDTRDDPAKRHRMDIRRAAGGRRSCGAGGLFATI